MYAVSDNRDAIRMPFIAILYRDAIRLQVATNTQVRLS